MSVLFPDPDLFSMYLSTSDVLVRLNIFSFCRVVNQKTVMQGPNISTLLKWIVLNLVSEGLKGQIEVDLIY